MAWIPAFAMMTSGSEWAKSDVDMRMDPRLRGDDFQSKRRPVPGLPRMDPRLRRDDFWAGCWL